MENNKHKDTSKNISHTDTPLSREPVKRIFIAIPLPRSLDDGIKRLQTILEPHYERWRPTKEPHLTLRFIGNTLAANLPLINNALHTIESVEIPIQFNGLGIFKKQNGIIIWVGMEKNPLLMHLQNAIDKALFLHAHIPLELRSYFPHITLGRAQKHPSPHPESFISPALLDQYAFTAKEFMLFNSILSSTGAQHCVEHIYPFSPL